MGTDELKASYVRLLRNDEGKVMHTESADEEVTLLRQRITDLTELLDMTRKIIRDQDRRVLQGRV